MNEIDPALLTRRQWLGKAPIAFIAAGLTGEEALAANTRETGESPIALASASTTFALTAPKEMESRSIRRAAGSNRRLQS